MVLGFKERFKEKIINGSKLHTIRTDANDRWYKGAKIHMATGVRTKNYQCFKEAICTGVNDVCMYYTSHHLRITINGRVLVTNEQKQTLALNDGFESVEEFEQWFLPIVKANKCIYHCKLIHWTDFRY